MGLKSFFIAQDLTFCEDLPAKILPWLMRTESMIRRRSFFEKMGAVLLGIFGPLNPLELPKCLEDRHRSMTTTWGVCMKRCLERVLRKKGRGWKGVELVREAWFCMIPMCFIHISMVVKYQICKLQTWKMHSPWFATCIQHKEHLHGILVPSSSGSMRWPLNSRGVLKIGAESSTHAFWPIFNMIDIPNMP